MRSSWLSCYCRRQPQVTGISFQSLTLGNRAFRLGQTNNAYSYYDEADKEANNDAYRWLAWIGKLQCLRLSGRLSEAKQLLESSEKYRAFISEDARREIDWERLCIKATETRDLKPLLEATRKDGSHFFGSYFLETYLWSYSCSSTAFMKDLPKIDTALRYQGLKLRNKKTILNACIVLEDCYQKNILMVFRIKKLGKVLAEASKQRTIDKELLLWAAAARWLVRVHSFDLATLAINHYANICGRLSQNKTFDCLNLISDLLESSWYKTRNEEKNVEDFFIASATVDLKPA